MSLKGIISISGQPGLYKVIAQSKSGFIVESLADKKRMPVSATQRISMLEDISVFTTTDDMPLKDVLLKMKEHSTSNEVIDAKSEPVKLKGYFKSVIPDFDEERVYTSDIKKIINWFHLLKDIVDVEDEEEVKATKEEEPAAAAEVEEAPKKKKTAKAKTTEPEGTDKPEAKVTKPRKKKDSQ